jgi:hypothetical protein
MSDEQIITSFEKLADGRPTQAAEFIDHLRRGGVAAFQRVFLGKIQSALPETGAEPSAPPTPDALPQNRWDERGFLLPQFRTPSTLMPKNRPVESPPDFRRGEGWAG